MCGPVITERSSTIPKRTPPRKKLLKRWGGFAKPQGKALLELGAMKNYGDANFGGYGKIEKFLGDSKYYPGVGVRLTGESSKGNASLSAGYGNNQLEGKVTYRRYLGRKSPKNLPTFKSGGWLDKY